MKSKILYLAPHLSTGGMPSFLLKQVELLNDLYDIYVVEYQFYTADFVVHRNAIKEILGDKVYTLGDTKSELIEIIETIRPDIIHLHDVAERFDHEVMAELYTPTRSHRIIETCHDVFFNPDKERKFHPDAYAFCTVYHKEVTFKNMPTKAKYVIEFPIDPKESEKQDDTKYVVNVGLWTPGKNQAEGIEIARKNPDWTFYFIGNQAGNFQHYWEPLMKDLPKNVKVLGERDDVDDFLKEANVFMFNSTIECNPLALREAIAYNLPIIAHNLPQYMGTYAPYIQPIDTDLNTIHAGYITPDWETSKYFAIKLSELYTSALASGIEDQDVRITEHNVNGPFVEINSAVKSWFHLVWKTGTGETVYENTIQSNSWAKLNRQYYEKWSLEVYEKGEKIYESTLNLEGKRVLISIDSKSLGDNIAWAPYALEFQKKHNCKVILSSFFANILDIPEVEIVSPGSKVENIHAQYNIGWYYDSNKEPVLPNTIPLQQAATNILGLEFEEIKPKLKYTPTKAPISIYLNKVVTIATNSTAGCKFWTKEGWQGVINYLHEKGYKVINVSLEENPFDNCEQIINHDINDTMCLIKNSDFFIGLGSGVSWLAWGLGVKTVMIANFSEPSHEFVSNCIRVTNKDVCNGCWNDPNEKFDKGDWNWCPRHKDTDRMFECQTSITAQKVIDVINKNGLVR
jgi:autotransporter strand-loop-strand O-heptosyltransferase